MSSVEPFPVTKCPAWTEQMQSELEESRRRPPRPHRPPARGRRPRPIRRRPVSPGLIARLQLSEADLSYWRQAVSRGEITIAELARRWGISRPSAHAVIRGSYRAK